MKTTKSMKIRISVLAVQGVMLALCSLPARADDAEAMALKTPTNKAEFGLSVQSQKSAKFGEYTGMNKEGGGLIGNFSLRGGDSYGGAEGTQRWAISGSDIGLTSRAFGAQFSDQGKWSLGVGYDELRRNLSDTYQTPYVGTMGGNTWTLPTVMTGVTTANPGARTLSAAQLSTFQQMDIYTQRENMSVLGNLRLNSQWDVKVDFNHLDQTGARLMGFGSYGSAAVGGAGSNEHVSILPMPTDYKTDLVTVALNWTGDQAFATGSYHGSFFRDANNGVKFQTWDGTSTMQTMGTAPNNDFHQLNLTGGYTLSPTTKMTGGLSYSRNTQDTPYAYDNFAMNARSPTVSLNGQVSNTHMDLKLVDQTTKDLTLSGSVKYDNRENRTHSNFYAFNAISGGNPANYPNTPLSIKKTAAEFAGDYRIDKDSKVRVAYNYDHTRRWCEQFAVNANYPEGTNCVVAQDTTDHKVGATYRRTLTESLNGSVGYSFSKRMSDYDTYARAAFVSTNGNLLVQANPAVAGINGGDYLGFHPYLNAPKHEQALKTSLNWQATDKLSFVAGARYTTGIYDNQYGVQRDGSSMLDVDGTYAYNEETTVSAYATQQWNKRDVTDLFRGPSQAATPANATTTILVPSGATWSNYLRDATTSFGLNMKRIGLMGGKLEILGDLSVTLAKSQYQTALNYYTTTSTPPGLDCGAATIMSCGALPIIRSNMIQFKLTGNYQIEKNAKIMFAYLHQSLLADDYKWNGMQYLYNSPAVLPTSEGAGGYSVNVVSATYQYDFK